MQVKFQATTLVALSSQCEASRFWGCPLDPQRWEGDLKRIPFLNWRQVRYSNASKKCRKVTKDDVSLRNSRMSLVYFLGCFQNNMLSLVDFYTSRWSWGGRWPWDGPDGEMGDSPRKRFDGFLALDMAMYLHIYNIYIHTIYVYNIYMSIYIYIK